MDESRAFTTTKKKRGIKQVEFLQSLIIEVVSHEKPGKTTKNELKNLNVSRNGPLSHEHDGVAATQRHGRAVVNEQVVLAEHVPVSTTRGRGGPECGRKAKGSIVRAHMPCRPPPVTPPASNTVPSGWFVYA